jgi:hypothetical protein
MSSFEVHLRSLISQSFVFDSSLADAPEPEDDFMSSDDISDNRPSLAPYWRAPYAKPWELQEYIPYLNILESLMKVYLCVCIYMYVYAYIFLCINRYTYVYIHIYIYVYMHLCIYTSKCMYIYIICIYIHIYIYIYIYRDVLITTCRFHILTGH